MQLKLRKKSKIHLKQFLRLSLQVMIPNTSYTYNFSLDKNHLEDESVWAPVSAILGMSFLSLAILASVKLYLFIKVMGVKLTLGQTVLTLEIISNLCTKVSYIVFSK